MTQLVQRKGFKIESTLPQKKKTKDKKLKSKVIEHVQIIDDDAPIPWATTIVPEPKVEEEIVSYEDAPVVVGIVDERPSEIREKDRFNDAKRWRQTAFEEVPEITGPQPKPTKSSSSTSHQKQNSSDDSDPEIDRRQPRRNNDLDLSPPRRKTQRNHDDPSPPRRRHQPDDDPSPPRRRHKPNDDPSPPRRRDLSLPRRKRDDPSPPRRKSQTADDSSPPRRRDSSPPRRKHKYNDDPSPPRRRDRTSPSHRHSQKESSTNRRQPKDEPSSPPTYRQPKQESSPPSSQPAKSERRRLAEHKEKVAERYAQWGRGIAQVQRAEDAVKDYLEQAEKPLARYRDDKDLDAMLKRREREDDPMLKYLSNKTADAGDRTNNSNSAPAKPRYRGPDPQKNRFDIWPGYRWDGVDRSNGYEKKLFESIANRHAKKEEAYLWSVEDM